MIALGCDHGGLNIKNAVIKYFEDKGIEYKDFGCFTEESVDYPEYAFMVAQSVTSGETELGILCCGTGIGISMAANKVKGINTALIAYDCLENKKSGEELLPSYLKLSQAEQELRKKRG